ncbi:hypothetical protein PHK61_12880 [Actinomycetospora lutea]|uniref:hypothetical protein n=1 Tax=Actinomycetospora lutea TaxID=663604 RepID=UPI00236663E3|nr:hypothetical protein [Actinomycetospora lutea]MDD7939311.1 hypothetical protein [Actinomycetospora lutea]
MAEGWTGEVSEQREGFSLLREIEALRESGETARVTTPFGHQATMVSRYADARELHGDPQRFRLDAVGAPPALIAAGRDNAEFRRRQAGNLLGQDPPDHTRLRRMLTGEFTVKRMKRLVPRVEEIVTEHLDAMERRADQAARSEAELTRRRPFTELVDDFALPVPSMVICELLGSRTTTAPSSPSAAPARWTARSPRPNGCAWPTRPAPTWPTSSPGTAPRRARTCSACSSASTPTRSPTTS